MILPRPDAILKMTTKRARTDLPEPFGVIEEAQVFLDLDVTEVVPVTELRRIQFVEQRRQLALVRNFFITAAAFDPEPDFLVRRIFGDAFQAFFHALEIRRRGGFAFFHRVDFLANIFAGKQFAFLGELDQSSVIGFIGTSPQMHDDKRRAETLREIDRLEGLLQRALAFLAIRRRKLIAIGRRAACTSTGSGQKLCRLLNFTSPASNIF